MQLFINNFTTTTTAADVDAADTQLSIPEEDAARLVGLDEGGYYCLTYAERDSSGKETAWEIIRVTGRSGGIITVERAQEGTTALDMPAGAELQMRLTAGAMVGLQSQLQALAARVKALEDAQEPDEPDEPDEPGATVEVTVTAGANGYGSFGYSEWDEFGAVDPLLVDTPAGGQVRIAYLIGTPTQDEYFGVTMSLIWEVADVPLAQPVRSIVVPHFGELLVSEAFVQEYEGDDNTVSEYQYDWGGGLGTPIPFDPAAAGVWYEGAILPITINLA